MAPQIPAVGYAWLAGVEPRLKVRFKHSPRILCSVATHEQSGHGPLIDRFGVLSGFGPGATTR